MPVCRSTVGALSRSRLTAGFASSKSLVPFLYQTATIQQRKPAVRPIARRNASSRSRPEHDVPFEVDDSNASSRSRHEPYVPFEADDSLPPSIDALGSSRQTTITGSERAAFEKLYRKFSDDEKVEDEIPFAHEIDQIADEWYEEDDDNEPGATSLDSVFDAVLSGLPPPGKQSKSRYNKAKKSGDTLQTLAESILRPEVEEARKKPRQEALAEAARIKVIREEEKARVQGLLEQAETDRALWETLEQEVFERIRHLDLDGLRKSIRQQAADAEATPGPSETKEPSKNKKAKAVEQTDERPRFPTTPTPVPFEPDRSQRDDDLRYDPRVLFPNFPGHLVVAARLLRDNFPSSPLPFSILPTVKSLGRSSYALGATTSLYNLLIRTAWLQYSSYDYIDELLTDMDNGGIEFDSGTLGLLDQIIRENKDARGGWLGPSIQKIFGMDQNVEGAKKLASWREAVRGRLGAWAEKQASEGKVVRKFDNSQERVSDVGPRDFIAGLGKAEKGRDGQRQMKLAGRKMRPNQRAFPVPGGVAKGEHKQVVQDALEHESAVEGMTPAFEGKEEGREKVPAV